MEREFLSSIKKVFEGRSPQKNQSQIPLPWRGARRTGWLRKGISTYIRIILSLYVTNCLFLQINYVSVTIPFKKDKRMKVICTNSFLKNAVFLLSVFFMAMLVTNRTFAAEQDTIVKRTCVTGEQSIHFDGEGNKYRIDITSSNGRVAIPGISFDSQTNTYSVNSSKAVIPIYPNHPGTAVFEVKYKCIEPNCSDSGTMYVKVIVCFPETTPIIENLPVGETMIDNFFIDEGPITSTYRYYYSVTNKCVYFHDETYVLRFDFTRKLWCAPDGTFIEDFNEKEGKDDTYLVLLNDGSVYELKFIHDFQDVKATQLKKVDEEFKDGRRYINLAGDDIYVMTEKSIMVTRDVGKTWQIDTNGLEGATPANITLDSNQNVYCATNKGLYKQALVSNTWEKVAAHPAVNMTSVYVDRSERIFTSAYGSAYKSEDHGNKWTIDTAGIGKKTVMKFGDDMYGNIYALTSTEIFRSQGGAGAWEKIDAGVLSKIDPDNATNIYLSIRGDSTLSLSTTYGLFTSIDQGNTWTYSNFQTPAENIAAYIKTPDNKEFISTNTGIYSKQSGDTVWTIRNPNSQSFNFAKPLFRDKAGNLYSFGAKRTAKAGLFAFNYDNIISSDNGVTWKQDTAGLSQINQGTYFVDENGVQYIFQLGNGSNLAKIHTKKSGERWKEDMAGFTPVNGASFEQALCWASDGKGTIFLVENVGGKGVFWKRSTGGQWALDSVGQNGALIYSIATDNAGNLYAGTYTGILMKPAGGTWQSVPYPKEVPPSASAFFVATDSKGTLFVTFATPDVSFNFHGKGAYFTKDNGQTWTYAGLNGIASNGFVAYGDTVYAFKNSHGLYALTAKEYSNIYWTPNRLVFGAINTSSSVNEKVKIYNSGNKTATVTVAVSSNPAFTLGELLTGREVKPNEFIDVPITFHPLADGKVSGYIVLTHDGDNKADTLFIDGEAIGGTGVEEPTPAQKLTIQPNPVHDLLIISTSGAKSGDITIFDERGRKVLSRKIEPSERIELDISMLSKGVYTVRIGDRFGKFVRE